MALLQKVHHCVSYNTNGFIVITNFIQIKRILKRYPKQEAPFKSLCLLFTYRSVSSVTSGHACYETPKDDKTWVVLCCYIHIAQ